MSHVLLVEVGLSGHHGNYLRQSVRALACSFSQVTVIVERPEDEPALVHELEACNQAHVRVRKLAEINGPALALSRTGGLVGRELAYYLRFRAAFRSVHAQRAVDLVFLPYADYCLYAIGLLGAPFDGVLWSGICMRPSFHYRQLQIGPAVRFGSVKRMLFERVLRSPSLVRMLTIDPTLTESLRQPEAGKLLYLADPTDFGVISGKRRAREILNVPAEAKVLLVYGAITSRKGVEPLVEALLQSPQSLGVCLLVVGKQTAEFARSNGRQRLSELASVSSVVEINAMVDDATEELAFASADAVWVGYENHFTMSGVLVMAGKARKPVIATRDGLIGLLSNRWRLGRTVDVRDRSAVAGLLADSATWEVSDPDAAAMSAHTWPNFRTILQRLAVDVRTAE